jgi:N-acetylneuraminic acid mutarotase
VIIGGANEGALKVEVYAYDDPVANSTSPDPCATRLPDFPLRDGSSAVFIKDNLIVCGGSGNDTVGADEACYRYNKDTNSWDFFINLLVAVEDAAVVALDENTIWVAGGSYNVDPMDDTTLVQVASSNLIDITDINNPKISQGIELPAPNSGFNLIKIKDDQFMLLGGDHDTIETYMIYDQALINKTPKQIATNDWHRMADLPESRQDFVAGMVTLANGTSVVVVAGGEAFLSTLMYNIEGNYWVEGPELPGTIDRQDAAVVQADDTFYIIGGVTAIEPYEDLVPVFVIDEIVLGTADNMTGDATIDNSSTSTNDTQGNDTILAIEETVITFLYPNNTDDSEDDDSMKDNAMKGNDDETERSDEEDSTFDIEEYTFVKEVTKFTADGQWETLKKPLIFGRRYSTAVLVPKSMLVSC